MESHPLNEGQFKEILPEILGKAEKVKAVFVTYNEVGGYKNGAVNTGLPHLEIEVQSGNLEYSSRVYLTMIAPLYDPNCSTRSLSDVMESEAATAFDRTMSGFDPSKMVQGTDIKLLTFIYSGLSGFEPSAELAVKVRREHPNATIILTMCDCGWKVRQRRLLELVQSGVVNHMVMNLHCGGYGLMQELLESLIETMRHHEVMV